MTLNLPADGQDPWGDDLNAALTTHDDQITTHDTQLGELDQQVAGIDTRVTSLETGGVVTSESRMVPLVIFNGESNSGGYADNSSALPTELLPRPAVQILDNIGLSSWQDLDIGTNNLVDHAGLSNGPTHGWELGLANSVEAGEWWDSKVYLIKTGQGGSKISDWVVGGTYWTKFCQRVQAAKTMLQQAGLVPTIYLWYSLGVNDAIAGTNETTWLADVKETHKRIRGQLGYVPIIMTKFHPETVGVNFNDSIDAYAASDPMVMAIECTGVTLKDQNHWDYGGMKTMAGRFVATSKAFGQHEGYLMQQVATLSGTGEVSAPADLPLAVATPNSLSFKEGTNGTFTVALNLAPAAQLTVTVSATGGITPSPTSLIFGTGNWNTPQTVTLTSPDDGAQNGSRSGTVTLSSPGLGSSSTVAVTVSDAQAPVASYTPFTWKDMANATQDGSSRLVVATPSSPCGGNATVTIDLTQPFAVVIDHPTSAETNATAFILDDAPSTDFTWANQASFLTASYHTGGPMHAPTGYGAPNAIPGWTIPFPCKVKAEKSGNDIVYSQSTDGGATWTAKYTHVGVLAGKTIGYPRVLFAAPAAGQKVLVSASGAAGAAPPTSNTAPAITGTTNVGDTLTCSQGSWGGSPTSYAYQWKRGGAAISGATANTHVIVSADQSTTLTCSVTATNADGSTTVTSAGLPIPGAGNPFVGVTWTAFDKTDSPAAGQVRCTSTGGGNPGALSTGTLDLTQPWELEVDLPASSLSQGVLALIDSDNTADFQWGASQVFVIGLYHYGDDLNAPRDGGTPQATGLHIPSYPCTIKMASSGTDVTYQLNTGSGYGSVFYTATGVLAGKSTGYIKSLFAVPAGGQNITVRRKQPV